MSDYSQGMNDLLAPILVVFLTEEFGISFFTFENNITEYHQKLTDDLMMRVSSAVGKRRICCVRIPHFITKTAVLEKLRWSLRGDEQTGGTHPRIRSQALLLSKIEQH